MAELSPGPGLMGRLRRLMAGYAGFERDARVFLLSTLVAGAAISLYWIDFNLYLAALGIDRSTIGLIAAVGSGASALVAFPASAASDRLGRRRLLIAGLVAMTLATTGFLLVAVPIGLAVLVAVYAAGQQTLMVVSIPFMTEHSRPEHRSELFALQSAISFGTNAVAAVVGGLAATVIAGVVGLDAGGAGVYRIVLAFMVVALIGALVTVSRIGDDRPRPRRRPAPAELGEPAVFPTAAGGGRSAHRFGIVVHDRERFAKLLLPGFLIALGAGQVIPFLNLFVAGKFGLDLAEINAAFAITSLGTVVATLAQPALAHRTGKVASVVIVQAASIPFLVVLGFSPILWTVVVAMAVRNSLMNASNPIANAFAMEAVEPAERATLAAAMSVLWSLGWVIAAPWYAILQATLGFELGYTVNFLTIITLYSTATAIYWHWFRSVEGTAARPGGRATAVGEAA